MKVLYIVGSVLLLTYLCGAPSFAYGEAPGGWHSLKEVKAEFGVNPTASIRQLIFRQDISDKRWKRVVTALAFCGDDGANLLMESLDKQVAAKGYGEKSRMLLESLCGIADKRVVARLSSILHSKAPLSYKLTSADRLKKQVDKAIWKGQPVIIKSTHDSTVYRTCYTESSEIIGDFRSCGDEELDRKFVLGLQKSLLDLAKETEKSEPALAAKIRLVTDAIEKKEQRLREMYREPLPEPAVP